jgi:hypothetical protein
VKFECQREHVIGYVGVSVCGMGLQIDWIYRLYPSVETSRHRGGGSGHNANWVAKFAASDHEDHVYTCVNQVIINASRQALRKFKVGSIIGMTVLHIKYLIFNDRRIPDTAVGASLCSGISAQHCNITSQSSFETKCVFTRRGGYRFPEKNQTIIDPSLTP